MALEHMMLSEKSQMQKDRYHLFPAEGQIPSIPSHGQEQISHGFKRSIIISLKIRERCKNSVSSWSSEAFLIRASGIMGIPMESNFKSLFWEANLHFLLIYSRCGHAVLKAKTFSRATGLRREVTFRGSKLVPKRSLPNLTPTSAPLKPQSHLMAVGLGFRRERCDSVQKRTVYLWYMGLVFSSVPSLRDIN